MKKIKHSKGPWEPVLCVDNCGSSFIINGERDLDDPIAIVPNDYYHKEVGYDSVLIAHAPQMARILFEIIQYEYNTEKSHYIELAFNSSEDIKNHIYFHLEKARKILIEAGYEMGL